MHGNLKSYRSGGELALRFFATLVVAATGMFVTRPAGAFDPIGASWAGRPSIPIQLQLGTGPNTVFPLLDGNADFNASCQQAVRLWNHYLSPGPLLVPTVGGTGPGGDNDGVTQIFFSPNIYGSAFGNGVLAVTLLNSIGSTFVETDILFNSARKWESYRGDPHFNGTQLIVDFQRVAIHEMGHLLGLDHPDKATPPQFLPAIMNANVSGTDIMQNDDIQGINFLYHGGPPNPGTPGTVGVVVNLSTRLDVLTGSSLAIPGFVVTGTGTKRVLVRAIGPTLTQFGITGALQAPTMELHAAMRRRPWPPTRDGGRCRRVFKINSPRPASSPSLTPNAPS